MKISEFIDFNNRKPQQNVKSKAQWIQNRVILTGIQLKKRY